MLGAVFLHNGWAPRAADITVFLSPHGTDGSSFSKARPWLLGLGPCPICSLHALEGCYRSWLNTPCDRELIPVPINSVREWGNKWASGWLGFKFWHCPYLLDNRQTGFYTGSFPLMTSSVMLLLLLTFLGHILSPRKALIPGVSSVPNDSGL